MAYNYNPEDLAQVIRAYRNREGLTLRQLAERTHISAATLSRIENAKEAKFSPDMYTLLALLNTCNLSLNEIIRGDNDADRAQIDEISTQLRASKHVSAATMQALEAVIRAAHIEWSDDKAS